MNSPDQQAPLPASAADLASGEHPLESMRRLMETLQKRARNLPEGSYTTRLLRGGVSKIGGKVTEEAAELIEAAEAMVAAEGQIAAEGQVTAEDQIAAGGQEARPEDTAKAREHFVYEAGDLLYHTLVLLAHRGVSLDEVAAELARREGVSGLAEKASRRPSPPAL
ncbi:MAG: phosphoribosyl-ATP diphosphatase [Planctomycetota bacterium]